MLSCTTVAETIRYLSPLRQSPPHRRRHSPPPPSPTFRYPSPVGATEDASGAHPCAPAAVVRCYGLGLLMNGGEVAKLTELTERGAGIKLPSGARHTFVHAANTGAVPLWAIEQ